MEHASGQKDRLRRLFARRDDPYAGGDLELARRLGAALWLVATFLTALLVPLAPPDETIGDAGWLVAAGALIGGLAAARWMSRCQVVTWDQLLAMSYMATVEVAVVDWLAGGVGTPYPELYIVVAIYAGALHPPRRVVGVVAAIGVCSALPLLYAGATTQAVGLAGLRFILATALAVLGTALMSSIRAQRLALRGRGDDAEQLARVDELTELPNRRAFTEALDVALDATREAGRPVALVVADLDDFKQINDVFGHQAGDACLSAVADALRSALREGDACFRWGGDEFALVLEGTELDEADVICRRVADAVALRHAPDGSPLRITCAPTQLVPGMTAEDLVAIADHELLARKRGAVSRTASAA